MGGFSAKMTVNYDDAVELDLYGIAIADGSGVILQVDGALNSDVVVGGRLTRDFMPLVGMDAEVDALRMRPGERLRLPKVSLGSDDRLVNLTIYWAKEKSRYLMVAMESVEASADMLPAIRLTRANRYLTEQLEMQRKHFQSFYENTPFIGITLFPDGQVSASTAMFRDLVGLDEHAAGGHAETLMIAPVIDALKRAGQWEPLWSGTAIVGVAVTLPVRDGVPSHYVIAARQMIDPETGLKEASLVLSEMSG